MASSGEANRELAVTGQGDRAAVSGHDGHAAVAVSGEGKSSVSGKRKRCDSILDYPCTERFRWRRLLAYLRENCDDQIYDVTKDKLGVILDVEDLVKRIKADQLKEACDYAWTFAPIPIGPLTTHAQLLTLFLHYLMAIHSFADGDTAKADIVRNWFTKLSRHPDVLSKYPCLATLVTDVLSLRTLHVRNSLDWQLVRNKAAEVVEYICSEVPHIKEITRYPHGQNELYDVMPIRCSFRRPRRQVKKVGKKQATDLAKFYLEMKKRLVPSAQMDYHDYSGSSRKLGFGLVMIKLFERVLKAGQRMVLKQGHSPEYLSRGVFTLEAAHVCKCIHGHMMIGKGHQPEHASNQEKVFQAVQPMMLSQGHRPEFSRGVFPLEAVHAYKSVAEHMKIEQGHGPEHASNQAMKCPRFLESHRDTVHQGNALKMQHITGNFVKI